MVGYIEFHEKLHSEGCFSIPIAKKLAETDLKVKMKDFEHLLFNPSNAARILHFGDAFLRTI